MASGSSSSLSKLFIGATPQAAADHIELMFNSQQDQNPMLQASMVPAPAEEDNDPNAYVVVAISPTSLLDSNRHICEVCYKGFARRQNLTLHRRSHNLPYSLKTRTSKEPVPRKVYLCPEPSCRHHSPSRALGDFGGLKKHYLRKHCNQKNYKCDTCFKAYTVETDLKAHLKTCGKKRGYSFIAHQENYEAQQHEGAVKHSPALDMGCGSDKSTFLNNSSIPIGSTSSLPPTFEMRDPSVSITTNDNINTLISPNIFPIENPSNSYQSQFGQFGTEYGSLMTNPFSIAENPSAFFSPLPTQQNQYGFHESSDTRFYADLLTDKIPLNNTNFENMNIFGDSGNIYGSEERSNSFSASGFTLDYPSSLHSTPAVHNTSLNNGMLNTVSGFNCVGSSTINQDVGGNYDQWGNYGYGNGYGNGFGNGFGTEHFNYGGEGEASNSVTSAATTGVIAPSEQHFNQNGFWF